MPGFQCSTISRVGLHLFNISRVGLKGPGPGRRSAPRKTVPAAARRASRRPPTAKIGKGTIRLAVLLQGKERSNVRKGNDVDKCLADGSGGMV